MMDTSILKLLENDAKMSAAQIASSLEMSESEVAEKIAHYEEEDIIAGYKTLIDWEKIGDTSVTALIEVKVVPQRGLGFERILMYVTGVSNIRDVLPFPRTVGNAEY